jgi:hypothetical protein
MASKKASPVFSVAAVQAHALAFNNDMADLEQKAGVSLGALLEPVKTYADWIAIGKCWQDVLVKGKGCTESAAERAWQRLVKLSGYKRPQTPEAAKKAAQRAKAKAAEVKPEASAEAKPEASKVGKGKAAAAAVNLQLNPSEAHLIALIRGAKWEMAASFIAKLAEQAAPV